jgi:hypothetical protein
VLACIGGTTAGVDQLAELGRLISACVVYTRPLSVQHHVAKIPNGLVSLDCYTRSTPSFEMYSAWAMLTDYRLLGVLAMDRP